MKKYTCIYIRVILLNIGRRKNDWYLPSSDTFNRRAVCITFPHCVIYCIVGPGNYDSNPSSPNNNVLDDKAVADNIALTDSPSSTGKEESAGILVRITFEDFRNKKFNKDYCKNM